MITQKNNKHILKINNLSKHFPIKKGLFRKTIGYTKAVNNVNLDIFKGETLGIVGESGCGKTTLGKCILRLLRSTSGKIIYKNNEGEEEDILLEDKKYLKKDIQIIFQDPYSSLNPCSTIYKTLEEPLKLHGFKNINERIINLLKSVNLNPDYLNRYPHEFSGGQRQRIGIARALSVEPKIIICDEPVSALDVSIQAQVLELLKELQKKLNLTYIFITHDISVVEYISDRIAIMYLGEIVELLDSSDLVNNCKHPYTKALISSVPVPYNKNNITRILLEGDVPDPSKLPNGCYFHPRCQHSTELCIIEKPELKSTTTSKLNRVSCHIFN